MLAQFLNRHGIINTMTQVGLDHNTGSAQLRITIFPTESTGNHLQDFDDLTLLISYLIAYYDNRQIKYSPQMQEILRLYYRAQEMLLFDFVYPPDLLPVNEAAQDQSIRSGADHHPKSCL